MEEAVNVGTIPFVADTQAMPTPGWRNVTGSLAQVSVGSLATVWGVDSVGTIWTFQNGYMQPVRGPANGLKFVSAAADGTVWGLDPKGSTLEWNGTDWKPIADTPSLSQISVASATQAWGVDAAGAVYQWNGSDWKQEPAPDQKLSWVSAAADGTVWGVNSAGVYRRDGSAWTPVPGSLSQISVGSATQVWGVSAEGTYQWNGSTWMWVSGPFSTIAAAADGTVWAGGPSSGTFYYVRGAPLMISNVRLTGNDLVQGGFATYQFDATNTAPGTLLQDIALDLLYDEADWAARGVTVVWKSPPPGPLAYGQTATQAVSLAATPTAATGAYAFYGASATYQVTVVPPPSASVPISSQNGGSMAFGVVPA